MKDLIEYLNKLEDKGELLRIKEEVSTKYDITAVTRRVSKRNGPAILFQNVKGYNMPVVTNLLGTLKRVALSLDIPESEVPSFLQGFPEEPPVIVEQCPVQEVVITDPSNILDILPVLTNHEYDVSPYITQGVVFMKDPETGEQTMGVHRLQVRGHRRLGLFLASKTSTEYYKKAAEKNRHLDVAIAIGVHPAILLAAVTWCPLGDKLSLAGGLLRQPVKVCKAKNVDLLVPAEAMIIIEGRVPPGVLEQDGPFGESTGTYIPALTNAIEISALTYRPEPVYAAFIPWTNEDELVVSLTYRLRLFWELKKEFPFIKALQVNMVGTLIVSVGEVTKAETRRLIYYCLVQMSYIKTVTVVNEDIRPDDYAEVEWAIQTRCQPDRDIIIIDNVPGSPIDPSNEQGIGSKLGIDATYPAGEIERFRKIAVPAETEENARQILAKEWKQY